MLAAFRANADGNLARRKFEWKLPRAGFVPAVIDDSVRVCVTRRQGRQAGINIRECYDKVSLHLLETARI